MRYQNEFECSSTEQPYVRHFGLRLAVVLVLTFFITINVRAAGSITSQDYLTRVDSMRVRVGVETLTPLNDRPLLFYKGMAYTLPVSYVLDSNGEKRILDSGFYLNYTNFTLANKREVQVDIRYVRVNSMPEFARAVKAQRGDSIPASQIGKVFLLVSSTGKKYYSSKVELPPLDVDVKTATVVMPKEAFYPGQTIAFEFITEATVLGEKEGVFFQRSFSHSFNSALMKAIQQEIAPIDTTAIYIPTALGDQAIKKHVNFISKEAQADRIKLRFANNKTPSAAEVEQWLNVISKKLQPVGVTSKSAADAVVTLYIPNEFALTGSYNRIESFVADALDSSKAMDEKQTAGISYSHLTMSGSADWSKDIKLRESVRKRLQSINGNIHLLYGIQVSVNDVIAAKSASDAEFVVSSGDKRLVSISHGCGAPIQVSPKSALLISVAHHIGFANTDPESGMAMDKEIGLHYCRDRSAEDNWLTQGRLGGSVGMRVTDMALKLLVSDNRRFVRFEGRYHTHDGKGPAQAVAGRDAIFSDQLQIPPTLDLKWEPQFNGKGKQMGFKVDFQWVYGEWMRID